MVVLKKIKAATLIETLTASVLIIIVFMIASLSFNTVFSNHIRADKSAIDNRIKELEYFLIHDQIKIPYIEDFGQWEITIEKKKHLTVITSQREGEKLYKKEIIR
ncbi:hypothetical protein ACFSTE_14830 [Aquimarina hainanensis]|uniref:Type II secretion system protein n=1 Tax=Aquimarina hainanensis TaxID=1578017 RepID=A0ABW5NB86_9FLAO|nr:hypothetical protein [Aquimarina sp. TRL1]QKX03551.1 hypothetical protein HN014_01020 [Aquimarina sp. TRL1]